MSVYTLRNLYKKSVIETETWRKVEDGETMGKIVTVETGWRWGTFTLTTNDGEAPELDLDNDTGLNPYHLFDEGNIEEAEMEELDDSVSFMIESDDLTEEELDELRERIEESSHIDVLEADGWIVEDTELEFQGPLVIFDEEGEEVARGEG